MLSRTFWIPVLVGLLMTVSVASQQSGGAGAVPARDWASVGGDWTNARHSTLAQINAETVKQLGATWISRRFEDGGSSRSTPVVAGGRMFMTAGTRVYALDARTGENLWTWGPDILRTGATNVDNSQGMMDALNASVGFPNPWGVTVGEGLIFVGLMDGQIAALDERTGQVRWRTQVGDDPPKRGQAVSSAPVYGNGMLFAGLANGDMGLRGRVVGLDAKSGRLLWTFFTVPGPGEPGHETWARDNHVWKLGGGGVWLPGAFDADLGLVYYATGNAVPADGGQVRPGNNLYTASVLALDAKTGRLAWHYQVVHHDLWEADIAVPLILYDAQIGGRSRKAVAAMRADGYLFLLDRATGTPILPVEERPVPQDAVLKTSPTQPFPVGADMLVPDCRAYADRVPFGFELGCQFTPPSDKPNVLATGFGVRVSPMSYSPQTGYIYAQGSSGLAPRRRFSTTDPWTWVFAPNGAALLGLPSTNVFAAIDGRTNRIVWKKEFADVSNRGPGGGGGLTTAGGLFFRSAADGQVEAYDARTGERLWQFHTGSPGGRGPLASYEIDGQQYIALTVGPEVWAFKLGGHVPPRAAPPPVSGPGRGGFEDTTDIETATLLHSPMLSAGNRYAVDQYTFSPLRARVTAGTRVTFTNNGTLPHTIMARDGSWTLPPIAPAEQVARVFDAPGTYLYTCKEHPWSIGQIVVAAATPGTARGAASGNAAAEQQARGRALYDRVCSACHGADLGGQDRNPALVGEAFLSRWTGRTAGDLFARIQGSMPPTAPGSREPREYADVVSYLLRVNNIHADEPLSEQAAHLRSITIR